MSAQQEQITPQSIDAFPRLRIAISDCLRGTECRYNGGHAQDDFVNKHLAKYADFFPFCPEAPVLGTPRETIRLVNVDGDIRVRGTKTGRDVTDGIQTYNEKMVPKLLEQNIDGAVVKSRSPSCGMERIKHYRPTGEWLGSQDKMGQGLFTASLQSASPLLPLEEEGRLHDAWLRENYMMRVFTLARWRVWQESALTPARLQAFHRQHKYLLMSKSEQYYRQLGPIVAQARDENILDSVKMYDELLKTLLACHAKRGGMVNVIEHVYGYFKKSLSSPEKTLYRQTLDEFRQGVVPMITIIKLLQQFLSHYGSDYLEDQFFFQPYPSELALRSSISATR